MANVDVNGVTLEYDVSGEGEPLLLVMGLGAQLTAWPDDFVALFVEQGFQVIRFDNRDIGLSTQTRWTPPPQAKMMRAMLTRKPLQDVPYTMSDMANDAIGLLDFLAIEHAHVMGVSMGGMIAQELAIMFPQRIRSLCSIMSNTGDRKNGGIAASLLPKVARQPVASRETAAERAVETYRLISGPHFDESEFRILAQAAVDRSYTPGGVARQTAAIAASRDRTELLGSVTAPTLVIHGLLDRLVKPSGGEATAKAIPAARLLAFPDMGHDLPRPRWSEMRDQIVLNARRSQLASH